jgi:four helix bundle protein
MQYDLEERTTKFGEKIIDFARSISLDDITKPLVVQLIKAGTSIGANYREANEGSSKKDFRNKIFICKKEANETQYWLRIIARAIPEKSEEAKILWQEAHELTLIFGKIVKKVQ